jgi:Tic22-like family
MIYKFTIGLVAMLALAVPMVTAIAPAQALPEAEILKKLQDVPIFTINDNKGTFLQQSTGTAPNNQTFTRVFVSFKDAQSFLQVFKNKYPQQGKLAQIIVAPLSEIYKLKLEAKKKGRNINFVFIPAEKQIKYALGIEKKSYQSNVPYAVPLFMVMSKQKDRYTAIQLNNVTPLFFEKEQAQQLIEQVKKQDPKLAANAKIEVSSLQSIVESFRKANNPGQQQIVIVPSRESIESIRKLQGTQPKPGNTPAASPPASTPPKK